MTQEEEVVLLDYWPSPFGTMARIALVEKGVNYIHKFEDLANKSHLLLEMNPVHHKIPVLVHKGKSICESNIIIQYIDEIWKNNSPLLPYQPYQRAKARFLVDFINKKVHGSSVKVWMGQNEEQENGKKELVEWSKFLEEELGDKLYFGGDVFGFVDIALVPFYNWFIVIKTFANFNTIEIECPKLVMWGERCLNRDSVSKSLPTSDQVYQAYLDFKKGVGISRKMVCSFFTWRHPWSSTPGVGTGRKMVGSFSHGDTREVLHQHLFNREAPLFRRYVNVIIYEQQYLCITIS